MIIDSSALIAILREETESSQFVDAILIASRARISAGNLLETAIVIDSERSPVASRRMDELVVEMGLEVEPFTAVQAKIAREAYRDFGKGSGHPAALNFGDCMAYALAKDKREPLLFKGNDFGKTDIRSAIT